MNESIEITIAKNVMGYRIAERKGSPVIVNRMGKRIKRFNPLQEDSDLYHVIDKAKQDGHSVSMRFSTEDRVNEAICDNKKSIGPTMNHAVLYAIEACYV